jgi:hypothetical protein
MLSLSKSFYVIEHRIRIDLGAAAPGALASDCEAAGSTPASSTNPLEGSFMTGGGIFVSLVLLVAGGLLTSILMEVFWSE